MYWDNFCHVLKVDTSGTTTLHSLLSTKIALTNYDSNVLHTKRLDFGWKI